MVFNDPGCQDVIDLGDASPRRPRMRTWRLQSLTRGWNGLFVRGRCRSCPARCRDRCTRSGVLAFGALASRSGPGGAEPAVMCPETFRTALKWLSGCELGFYILSWNCLRGLVTESGVPTLRCIGTRCTGATSRYACVRVGISGCAGSLVSGQRKTIRPSVIIAVPVGRPDC